MSAAGQSSGPQVDLPGLLQPSFRSARGENWPVDPQREEARLVFKDEDLPSVSRPAACGSPLSLLMFGNWEKIVLWYLLSLIPTFFGEVFHSS